MKYIDDCIVNNHICGDGKYTKLCNAWIEKQSGTARCMLTTSCTHALEMTAYLLDIKEGDEVILPSYTFASTADAFAMRGACLVFVDIRPDTMNIDEKLIEEAITSRTKAIVPVHYAGVACEMNTILDIAKRHNIAVVEDAAQGVNAFYHGKALGTLGDYGCYSFHETKNYSMGEGGAILIKDSSNIERAEILREKGTDRSKFFRGEIDKYTWVGLGSSYLPSELNAAYLWAQLEQADVINQERLSIWKHYHENLENLEKRGYITRPIVPMECEHNAHMYYIKLEDQKTRAKLIDYLNSRDIKAVFHYVPLHSAPSGQRYGRFHGEDKYTTRESERILRLPLYQGMTEEEQYKVIRAVNEFFE